ncbi:nuclear transport factor 2 family protein [Streptomyces olivaceoviridis]
MDAGSRIRASIDEHGRASDRGDIEAEHAIYAADAMPDSPQSGERFRGRETIAVQRGGHPADRHFTLLRITGHAQVWVSGCVITYDGKPSYAVSLMEFAGRQVVHETRYFAGPFGTPAWRAALAEPMPGRTLVEG